MSQSRYGAFPIREDIAPSPGPPTSVPERLLPRRAGRVTSVGNISKQTGEAQTLNLLDLDASEEKTDGLYEEFVADKDVRVDEVVSASLDGKGTVADDVFRVFMRFYDSGSVLLAEQPGQVFSGTTYIRREAVNYPVPTATDKIRVVTSFAGSLNGISFQDLMAGDHLDPLSAHTPEIPGSGVYTVSGGTFQLRNDVGALFPGSHLQVASGGTSIQTAYTTVDALGAERDIDWFADFLPGVVTAETNTTLLFRVNAAGTEALGLHFRGGTVSGTREVHAVRFAGGIGSTPTEDVTIATAVAVDTATPKRLGVTLVGAQATYWLEDYGGGNRTTLGTHTFAVSYSDTSHRRMGFRVQGAFSFTADYRWDNVHAGASGVRNEEGFFEGGVAKGSVTTKRAMLNRGPIALPFVYPLIDVRTTSLASGDLLEYDGNTFVNISVLVKSQLPGAIAYEDEGNTFTVANTFSATATFSGTPSIIVNQNIVGVPNLTLRNDTADGADTETTTISGGGADSVSRGAVIRLRGNESAGEGGWVKIVPGQPTPGSPGTIALEGPQSTGYQYTSTVVTGTSPFVVASTTLITNLNADLLDGFHASDFSSSAHTHPLSDITEFGADGGYIRSNGVAWVRVSGVAFTDVTYSGLAAGQLLQATGATGASFASTLTGNYTFSAALTVGGQITSTLAIGTAPFVVTSTTKVANLNVDSLDDQSGAYYLDSANFTGTNWTDLTDGGGTTLHSHAASTITSPAALTKGDDANVTLTLGGSPTTALLNAASLTLGWTGQLSIARGGTGLSAVGAAGTILHSNGSAAAWATTFTGNYTFSAAGTALAITSGNLTVGGTATVTGASTLAALTATSLTTNSVGNPLIDFRTSGVLRVRLQSTAANNLSILDSVASAGAAVSMGPLTATTISGTTGTFTGLVLTPASASGGAGFRLPHGAAPTTPTDGDTWSTTAGVFARINGATVGPFIDTAGSSTFTTRVTATLITEQIRAAYDASNYLSVTVGSAGDAVFNAVGVPAGIMRFQLEGTTVLELANTASMLLRYDGSNLLNVSVSSAGAVTYNAIGASAAHSFLDQLTAAADFAHQGTNLGFYGTSPIAQQTGVAVTAAGIHAALVNLGLITA